MIPKVLQPYSKAVVAGVAIAALIGLSKFGVNYPDLNDLLMAIAREALLGALGTWGVWQVTNKER